MKIRITRERYEELFRDLRDLLWEDCHYHDVIGGILVKHFEIVESNRFCEESEVTENKYEKY